LVYDHLATLVVFPLFLLFDILWNLKNKCFSIFNILVSLAIGGGVGVGWSVFLDYGKIQNFHFIKVDNSSRKGHTCGVLKDEGRVNCFVYKNGQNLGALDGDGNGHFFSNLFGKGGGGDNGDGNSAVNNNNDDDIGCN
jgi:hypothetical protein